MSYIGSTPLSQSFAPGTDTFNGDGTTVAFTLSRNVATVNDILVVVNNVEQQPSAYTVSVSTLTFSAAPSSGTNNIYVRYLTTNLTAIVPSATGTANSTTFLRGDNTWAVVSVTPTAVSDQNNTSTGYFDLPSGTTAQRPVSPPTGASRFNTTLNYPEYYDGTTWWQFNQGQTYSTSYLIVAGGGAGGGANNTDTGGGGGAGGLLSGAVTLARKTVYTITVGGGGTGVSQANGGSGTNSSAFGLTAIGGGGGAYRGNTAGSGGSGGGTGTLGTAGTGTSGQGRNGGTGVTGNVGGGGGGGATNVGSNGAAGTGGAGGAGTASSITGSSVTYAGGGGGAGIPTAGAGGAGGGGAGRASGSGTGAGTAGTTNTGGGGGGAYASASQTAAGGNGGSGVVIISMATDNYSGTTTGSPSVTTIGGNTILTFTSSGSYTA
jgi:hypothetical protein